MRDEWAFRCYLLIKVNFEEYSGHLVARINTLVSRSVRSAFVIVFLDWQFYSPKFKQSNFDFDSMCDFPTIALKSFE